MTGESRASRYRLDAGEFKSIRPKSDFDLSNGTLGTLKISACYAEIGLNDNNILDCQENALSLALNWYPSRNLRIFADLTRTLDTNEPNSVRMFALDMNVSMLRT